MILKMNGIIIVNQELGHNKYKIERFKEEFYKYGVSLNVFVNNGTLAVIKDNNIEVKLPKCDFIIYEFYIFKFNIRHYFK